MGELLNRVQRAVREERYFFSDHADNMLRERGIAHWQVSAGLGNATILSVRPQTKPNPTVEVEQVLAEGTPIKVVWAHVPQLTSRSL